MSKRTGEMVHDFVYGKLGRGGSTYRQVKANGIVQMSYNENTIYSYNTRLAEIDRDNNTIIVYEDTREYSNTSREHYDDLLNAVPPYYDIYYNIADTKENMIKYNLNIIDDLIDKQSRAKTVDYRSKAIRRVDRLYRFLDFLKYDKRKSEYRSIKDRVELLNLDGKELKEAVANAKIKHLKEERALQRKRDLANLKFKQKELSNFLEETTTKYDVDFVGVRLKVKDNTLYTSNHIKLPLRECLVMYKRYKQGKKVIGLKVDEYTILKLDSKTVTIGCTLISLTELDRLLKDLV